MDPLAWLWTKEIQFRNLTHFRWSFGLYADLRKNSGFGWFSGWFGLVAQSSPESRLMSKSCYYCPSGPTSMAQDERFNFEIWPISLIFGLYADLRKIQDLDDFRDETQSSPQSRLMSKSCYYCPSGPTSMALDERNSISKFDFPISLIFRNPVTTRTH